MDRNHQWPPMWYEDSKKALIIHNYSLLLQTRSNNLELEVHPLRVSSYSSMAAWANAETYVYKFCIKYNKW